MSFSQYYLSVQHRFRHHLQNKINFTFKYIQKMMSGFRHSDIKPVLEKDVPSHTSKYRTCSMSAVIHVRSRTWCSDTEAVSDFSNRFYIFWALVIILSSKDEIFLITLISLEVWVCPEERGVILTLWASFSSLGSIEAQSIALPLPLTFIPLQFPDTRRTGQMLGSILWIRCILT